MKAVIMAGGEGTRLRPLTSNSPKPMLPVANKPMMEHIVGLLREHGFDDIVVTLAFLPQAVRTYFGDGSEFGVRMQYATEETPLGTAGSVRNAMDALDERFLVISGDVLTDIDLTALVRFHDERKAMATIGLKRVPDPLEFGIVITHDDGSVERFLEKPTWGQVFSDTINTGIYVLEPEIFEFIAPDKPVDFSSDVFPALLDAGRPIFGHVGEGYWEDVGTLEAYVKAHQDILDHKVAVTIDGFQLSDAVWLGEGAEIDPDARVDGPAIVGDYSRIEAGAHLRDYAVLGANVLVGPDAFLERTVVHDNAYLGPAVRLRGAVIGRSCDLRRGARCEEGVVLGDECFVGEHAVLNPGVKVYPFKTVEPGAIVNSSIVWESRGARHLFGRSGISGLANIDISPELAVRVAMAFGTTVKKGSTLVASRDSSRAARALKRAVMVGLNASGVNVQDLEAATVPVTRFLVRSMRAQGGFTVRLVANDPQSVSIRFFDADGIDIDEQAERKVERLFHREDFRRAYAADIGDIGFPSRALEFYTLALMDSIDATSVR
ncbi:MAG TPA: sugar phosphate nucleotidyltransferase, partial [Acidimicrobiales bacterium]|nr:sugar phosphate nucleotidyltransferase [Acidimicrobiales bacterium]